MAEKRAKAWIFAALTRYRKYLPERFSTAQKSAGWRTRKKKERGYRKKRANGTTARACKKEREREREQDNPRAIFLPIPAVSSVRRGLHSDRALLRNELIGTTRELKRDGLIRDAAG